MVSLVNNGSEVPFYKSSQGAGFQLFNDKSILVYVTIILVGFVYARYRWKSNVVYSLPGPISLPVIGSLHYLVDHSQTFQLLTKWFAKYGPIFRIEGIFNEPYILLNNATHVQAILSSNRLELVSKPPKPYEKLFGQFLHNGLLISKGEYWKSHRRILSRAFTYKSMQDYIKIFNKYSQRLVDDLGTLFSSDLEPRQIASVMGFDLCNDEEGMVFYENVQRYKIISSKRTTNPFLLIDFFWRLLPISREFDMIVDTLNSITKTIIDKQREIRGREIQSDHSSDDIVGRKPCRSMIDELLASDMTQDEIMAEVNTVVAAGFESTSLTVQYILFMLALNPRHQTKCQEEIDDVFNDPAKHHNGNLTLDAISELKYLERCCLETLRLFPVIFQFQRQLEIPVRLDDKVELPAGTNVIISSVTIHKNEEYYPNPDIFDPDRFLPSSCLKRHPYGFLPFSAGIRNCIGLKFAMREMKTITAYILRHFYVSTVDDIDDVTLLPSIAMTPERDYRFILKRRFAS